MTKCNFCYQSFKSSQGISAHLAQDLICQKRLWTWQRKVTDRLAEDSRRRHESDSDESQHSDDVDQPDDEDAKEVIDTHPTVAAELKKRRRVPFSSDYEDVVTKDHPHGPFPTKADWDIAEWSTLESVSDAAVTRLLALKSVHSDDLNAKLMRDIHSYIDKLPNTAQFQHKELIIEGQDAPFDCFYRNAVDLVRDLLADPTFDEQLLFRPVHRYTSKSKKSRKYSEWNTGDWAWEIQAHLHHGATTIPIILATDKTELTSFTGNKTCYPVYMTIGNIPKHLRRQPSMRARRLLAYLPTGKVDGTLHTQLFHKCMSLPAKKGEVFIDSRGIACTCHTILAAYVADYPEQCLITCVRYGQACPVCDTLLADFDKDEPGEPWSQGDTIATIDFTCQQSTQEYDATLEAAGLTNVPEPFWKKLVQGMGKHLVSWLIEVANDEDELDARFQHIPYATGLHRFRDGMSTLSNVSGTEHKAIYAQLLGCIHGIVPDDAIHSACSLLDFIYVAQYECHSDDTLSSLLNALSNFHKYKGIFKEHNYIRRLGTVDNYNTECTERLRVDLAKHAYAATNKCDYEVQMCRWLQRREAVTRFRTFLNWQANELIRPPKHVTPPAHPILLKRKPHRLHYKLEYLKRELREVKFVEPLEEFLCCWHRSPTWRGYTTMLPPLVTSALARMSYLSLWHHIKFITPNTETLASKNSKSTAYASPARGQYDPVLVRLLGEDVAGSGGINDLRVGRLRAIFKIPEIFSDNLFGDEQPEHLALVELYLPLGRREQEINGMYLVQKPLHPIAVVVEVHNLRRAAHLFPKFGTQKVDCKLTALTVLDEYKTFYLNNHIDKDAYRNIYWVVGQDEDEDEPSWAAPE
ncbi:hypothetical protein BKA62DRAFT_744176 [Auriculariales sp. MPI-PUGE-AT-0066]|nr:hypothetical protein BKA62DRAFT_744176 [Auriculariales sp. MPI-PUGE-AT-0066]